MALHREPLRHHPSTFLERAVMVRIGETPRNRPCERPRGGSPAWCQMAADTVTEPFGNPSDVECRSWYSRCSRRRTDGAEWLGPRTRHDEQIDAAVELRHL